MIARRTTCFGDRLDVVIDEDRGIITLKVWEMNPDYDGCFIFRGSYEMNARDALAVAAALRGELS